MAADLSHLTKSWNKDSFLTNWYFHFDSFWHVYTYTWAGLAPGLIGEILLVKFIVKIIEFFLRHSKIRTHKKSWSLLPIFWKNSLPWFSLYFHLLLYMVKKVASQKTFFENIPQRSGCQSMKKNIWHLLIFHTEASDIK